MLGHRIVDLAIESGHEVFSSYRSKDYPKGKQVKLDLENLAKVREGIREIEPEAIINAAAFTDVDGCEENPEKAFKINGEAPRVLAEVSEDIDTHLIQVSTDYVFDGEKGNYREDDPTNPQSVYGKSKLEGEKNVKENCSRWTIARTSVIYGWEFKDKLNFATWIIKELTNENEIQIVDDQYNSPTLNTNLAEVLIEVAEKEIKGLFHVAGSSRVSRHDFSKKLAEVFDLKGELIERTKMSEMDWNAHRPRDSFLNVSKSEKTFNNALLTCEESLQKMRDEKENWDL